MARLFLYSAVPKDKSELSVSLMKNNRDTAALLLYVIKCVIVSAGLIEQRDSQPLLKLIESIGDWPVASDDWNTTIGRNASIPHSDKCPQSVPCEHGKRAHATFPHKQALTFLLDYMCAHRAHVAIFVLSELLSVSLVGGIKRTGQGSLAEQSGVELGSVMSG